MHNFDAYLDRQLDNYLRSQEAPYCKNSHEPIEHNCDYYLFEEFATVEDYLEYNDFSADSIMEVLETVDQHTEEYVVNFITDEIDIDYLFHSYKDRLVKVYAGIEDCKDLKEYFIFMSSPCE
jgi:hypothetical protein